MLLTTPCDSKCERVLVMPLLVPQHKIFPVKGRETREYLLLLGCSVGSEMMTLPDHLKMVPRSVSEITYAVMRNQEEVFCMQYYHLMNRWRIVVPLRYQVAFPELASSYGADSLWTGGVFGSYEEMLQLMQRIPIQHTIAVAVLNRLSDYTGHPYDLENVKIALTEQTGQEKERETNLVRN